MFGAIKYNLTHLADFRGRDARQTFWYYVLFLAIIEFVAGFAMTIPMMVGMFGQIAAAARSGATDPEVTGQLAAAQMSESMQTILPFSIALNLLMIALFVAAFVRRLHDSNKSGSWAVLPIATQLVSVAASYSRIGKMQAMMEAAMQNPQTGLQYQREMAPYSLLPWLGYLIVIVFGIMKSTAGPNRYGDASVAF